MADVASVVSSPDFLWKIPNYSTSGNRSSAMSCFGVHWKVQFVPYSIKDTRLIGLFLKCLNASENVKTLEFSFDTSILAADGSLCSNIDMTTKIKLKDEEWLVWFNSIGDVKESFGPGPDITFHMRISISGEIVKQIFSIEKIMQQVKEENVSCIKSLSENMLNLYINSEHSDFELRCKGWSKPVHKSILSARCGYFAALFSSPMKESDEKYAEFDDIEPVTLQHVIHYMYTGNFSELALSSVREVYAIAERFDFQALKIKCASLITDDFENEDQTDMKNENINQVTENLHDSNNDDRKKLLKHLFKSPEWKILFEEYPDLAEKMCRPVILDFPKI